MRKFMGPYLFFPAFLGRPLRFAALFLIIWTFYQTSALASLGLSRVNGPTPCLDSVATPPAPADSENLLRIVYTDQGNLGVWQEETRTTTPFPLPAGAVEVRLSADGQRIAFWQALNENDYELWLINRDGSNARKLVTASAEETLQRYPNAVSASPWLTWLENSQTLAYSFSPTFDALGEVPLETVHLVDADTGQARVIIPPGEVNALTYAPDGSQIAALTATELRLIDAADGRVAFTLPLPLTILPDQSLAYSPDGQVLVVFTTDGLTIVNPADGSQRDVALAYEPVGLGHTSLAPPILWLDNEPAFYTLINDSDDLFDPAATFTVWRIDLAPATATPVNTFTGNFLSVAPSPDLKRLAFWTQDQQNNRQLFLADVVSGRQILYQEGPLIEFLGWNPDATRFIYRFFNQPDLYLGHLCQPSRTLETLAQAGQAQWVDTERFLALEGQPGQGRLRLYGLNHTSTLVATLLEESPSYSFYFEEPPAPPPGGN